MGGGCRLGIDLGGSKIAGLVLDAGGATLAERRVATPAGDYVGTVAAVVALVTALERQAGVRAAQVGIGTPGAVTADGVIKNANSVCLNGQPLLHDLQAALGRALRLANDADCLAVSEATDGAAAGASSVFGVILGTGVGGGLVVGGRLLAGANAIAGEWGHNPLAWPGRDELPGPNCWCGKRGCYEVWLSGPALAADYQRRCGVAVDAAAVAARAEAGEALAAQILDAYADRLARGLAGIINIVDPEVIVLGGGLSRIGQLYERVPALLGRYVFSDTVRTRLAPAVHGDASGVRGAAYL